MVGRHLLTSAVLLHLPPNRMTWPPGPCSTLKTGNSARASISTPS
jgi:hypothetical protein